MGKTYKIVVCGKKATGKTTLLEQLIYNNANISNNNNHNHNNSVLSSSCGAQQTSTSNHDAYIPTIEDIYVANWDRDKGVKETLRFYDTKGMLSSRDTDTINQMRHLFSGADGAVLVFSSSDADSLQCVEKLKNEIEKSKDKKETCHFVFVDNCMPVPVNVYSELPAAMTTTTTNNNNNKEQIRQELQSRMRSNVYELSTLDKRDLLSKPFVDLATNITQISSKSSMNIVQSIKKPKVFSSSK